MACRWTSPRRWRCPTSPIGRANLYRTREEIEAWRKRDPILRLQGELIAQGRFEAAELADIEKAAQAQIEAALEFAKASPDPDPAELTRDVYAH